jgi:RNA polymerase sigma-70 factor, ECF subfamily
MPNDEQEAEAILRLRRGDIGGLETLVHAYHARAVRCAFLVVHDHALALDVTQAAFVKAYERIDTFEVGRAFGPWFLKSVLRDAIKAANLRERTAPLEPGIDVSGSAVDPVDPAPGPAELWEQHEVAQIVLAALAELPPAERAAIVQRYYLNLSETEMAEASHAPRGTVKWRLHAARGKLRPRLRILDPGSEVL